MKILLRQGNKFNLIVYYIMRFSRKRQFYSLYYELNLNISKVPLGCRELSGVLTYKDRSEILRGSSQNNFYFFIYFFSSSIHNLFENRCLKKVMSNNRSFEFR